MYFEAASDALRRQAFQITLAGNANYGNNNCPLVNLDVQPIKEGFHHLTFLKTLYQEACLSPSY